MPDLYAEIAEIPEEAQEMLAQALTVRAEEDQMKAMRRRYFGWLDVPEGGRGLEIGCGTGHVSADLLAQTALAEVVGLDPSPVLVGHARRLFDEVEGLSFVDGDARAMDLPDAGFDLVVFHTVLCHVPEPERALAEAFRVLKPGGRLAVFDGDYATISVSIRTDDPLQVCASHLEQNLIHDPWLCRRLPTLLAEAGFVPERRDAHPYLSEGNAAYFQSIVTRGADFMLRDGLIGEATAAGLKADAAARVKDGSFFGFISFLSVLARKPD